MIHSVQTRSFVMPLTLTRVRPPTSAEPTQAKEGTGLGDGWCQKARTKADKAWKATLAREPFSDGNERGSFHHVL